ncbi:phospholipase D-like domain-containing protein [Lachnospiraceae bacterium OttesenSCG-928-J05]|nr:phospholipase D-like domain-containing protein [Lachnospiraceae bacterium OttesenSCG-928-J05]MDL2276324.1 phospholipase D-like domain-containing protein [Breznakia sp. OttesenSCG-928-G09]
MQERDFKKLLIETVKIGDHQDKDRIIELLRLITVHFEKTGTFTRHLWNHCEEYIYLCIFPDKLIELKRHTDYLSKICYEIYPPNDDYELWGVEIKPGALPNDEEISQDILFEDIQHQIIDEIKAAKYTIWIAMAWFTDPDLHKELLKKEQQGLNIQIVIDDNERNRKAPFDLEASFETHWISIESLYKNIMHDKFCIIDLQTVIHGTFNWTRAAQYNKETISVDKNRETAETFADEFIKLKKLALR